MLFRNSNTGQRLFLRAVFALFALSTPVLASYVWPNPQYEALEALLYEGNFMSKTVGHCSTRVSTTVAAEWLRLAYHDMATFNKTDGTGGLDASIYYELNRDDNIGEGMMSATTDFSQISDTYTSRADVIAIGTVMAVAGCNGPIIPFRGGRVDALSAGRTGVPFPTQSLEEHIDSFRLQGFNASEMIGLVACGHTLGGVHEQDFPAIVPTSGDPSNPRFDAFDSNPAFDSVNVLNTSSTYLQTCQSLLARMINTVPSGVVLTEEILPIPFKISQQRFLFVDGKLAFKVTVRVLNHSSTQTSPVTVRLLWCDRRGSNVGCADDMVNVANAIEQPPADDPTTSVVADRLGITFSFYTVAVPITFERSVGQFWFSLSSTGASNTTLQDNAGMRYIANTDEIVYFPSQQTQLFPPPQSTTTLYAAAIHTSAQLSGAVVHVFDNAFSVLRPFEGPEPIFNVSTSLSRDTSFGSVAGYDIYSAPVETGPVFRPFTVEFTPEGTDGSSSNKSAQAVSVRPHIIEQESIPQLAIVTTANLSKIDNGRDLPTSDSSFLPAHTPYTSIYMLLLLSATLVATL